MTMSFSRRETLFEGALAFLWTSAAGICPCSAFIADQRNTGCHVSREEAPSFFARTNAAQTFRFGTEDIEPRSGDPHMDRALAQTLARLARMFDVLPGFAYFREHDRKNALATPQPLLERSDGTVLFGLQLLRELLARPEHPDASVVAVCAHEFGHIVGYKTGLIRQLAPDPRQPFRAEQHADYLAGFFAGVRRRERPDFPAVVFAMTMRTEGGVTRGSHGTSEERAQAVVEGFKAAYERQISVSDGITQGFQFAMSRV